MEAMGHPQAGAAAYQDGTLAPQWPMSVEAFLSGPYLQRSDVVLTRKHRDLRSWMIRWATQGSFSHAALVFLVPHQEKGFNNTFVIESASKGVDLKNLADYLKDRRSVVGIKRLSAPWFQGEPQSLVRGRMLNNIQSKYSYATAFNIALDFLSYLAFGFRSRVQGTRRAIKSRRQQVLQPPNEFICSGLVQLGFVQTTAELVAAGYLPPECISEVTFQNEISRFLPLEWGVFTPQEQHEMMWDFVSGFREELEAITPEDLAISPRLDWVYIIRGGEVYAVNSEAEARELLNWRPKAKRLKDHRSA